jgi:hypothetical protein
MSLLFKKMAKYVATIFLSIGMVAMMAVSVDAQKKSGGSRAKPKTSIKSKKQKPKEKTTPRPKKQIPKPILVSKNEIMLDSSHYIFHLDENSWRDATKIIFVFVVARHGDGVIRYRLGTSTEHIGEELTMSWDKNTAIIDPSKLENGCFMIIYCTIHNMALYMQRTQC